MLITVFTPLYNREKSIRAVYDSLCVQSNKNFEWLVINDGSTDGSDEIMDDIISNHDNSFQIYYYKKSNEGLNRTINKGLDLAKGELFFRLDSDDTALPDAIDLIQTYYPKIKDDSSLCAVTFLSQLFEGRQNGYHPFVKPTVSNFVDYRFIHHGTGDRSEVMKLDVYRKYRFPEFEGEKFCSEGVVWDRIAKSYNCLYVPKAIYKKGFEEDTITSKIYSTLKACCQSSSLLYYELIRDFDYLPYKALLINTIKYYRYAFYAKRPIFKGIPFKLWVLGLPLGLLVIARDFIMHPESFVTKKK